MTWISLVCLLVLSSSAFGRTTYGGGYGSATIPQMQKILPTMREQTIVRPFLPTVPVTSSGYETSRPITPEWSTPLVQQDIPIQSKLPTGYGSSLVAPTLQKTLPVSGYGFDGISRISHFDQPVEKVPLTLPLTPADELCRGQRPETVIPFENNRKFVVCLDDGKGVEQHCPKGLFWHETSRRCERKLGPLEDPCISQPCLNGGVCSRTEDSYQCQCTSGFDGKHCELDARVCLSFPCGQSPDVRCQSFRWGAALPHICIFQDGLAYGLNAQQIQSSPCTGVDGVFSLAVSNKGFVMCDGERMFVESCPGGTIWDDFNKACVWPDMQSTPLLEKPKEFVDYSYGQQRTLIKPTFTAPVITPQLDQSKFIKSYGTPMTQFDLPKRVESYGTVPQLDIPKRIESYGGQMMPQLDLPKRIESFTTPILELPKRVESYGSQIMPQFDLSKRVESFNTLPQFDLSRRVESFNTLPQFDIPKRVESFGGSMMPQFDLPKRVESYGGERQFDSLPVKQVSGY